MKLKELADKLGLSPTTVSRALNGYPEVSEATRTRVQRMAKSQNYRPNRRATGLATGRAMTIGHIIPLVSRYEMVSPIFAEFMAGASQTYNDAGYELLLSFANQDNEEEIYRGIVAKGSVDGVILHAPQRKDPRIDLLQDIGVPFVMHGRVSEREQNYSWIDVNNRSSFYQSTRLLVSLGHKRIAFINGEAHREFSWRRQIGFEQALGEANLECDPSMICNADMTETVGLDFTKQLLKRKHPPTAILASSYVVGLGARRAIGEAGLVMGKDVSVAIHDDELSYFHNGGDIPLFTGTRSSVRHAGELAAELLLKIIADKSVAPTNHLLQSHLVVGSSTGPAPN